MRYLMIALLLAGCAAAPKLMTLHPRAPATTPGRGTVDMTTKALTVTVGDNTYRGSMIYETLSGANNKASSVLLGPGGQMRCDITFGPMLIEATGICVDSQNRTYDVLVK